MQKLIILLRRWNAGDSFDSRAKRTLNATVVMLCVWLANAANAPAEQEGRPLDVLNAVLAMVAVFRASTAFLLHRRRGVWFGQKVDSANQRQRRTFSIRLVPWQRWCCG
jgi:hypothetical protein